MNSNRTQSSQEWRFLNRDGSLNIHRMQNRKRLISDLYHYFLSIPWPKFFAFVILGYLLTNFVFAALYFLCGQDALNGIQQTPAWARFADCYFFSVQTLATIGYGHISPKGFFPNILVTIQALLGMLTLALTTGILYARFSHPTAMVTFSDKAIIGPHNGNQCFYFRVANERLNQVVEAHVTVTLIKNEVTKEGENTRKFYILPLEREYSPMFALSWTVRHTIDRNSPLWNMDHSKLLEDQVEILASLSGIDEIFSQTVSARISYTADDIVYGVRFKDILSRDNGKIRINLQGIHDVETYKLGNK